MFFWVACFAMNVGRFTGRINRTPVSVIMKENDVNYWTIAPLSTPAVLSTLSHWLHDYDRNTGESTSIMEMMGWQEMVSINDQPGFHLSVGLCYLNTVRAIVQFQTVHSDKKNLLILNENDNILDAVPITIRAIATNKNEDIALNILMDIFHNINNGPILSRADNGSLIVGYSGYIQFNWQRLKLQPRVYLDVLYHTSK